MFYLLEESLFIVVNGPIIMFDLKIVEDENEKCYDRRHLFSYALN